MASTIDLNEVRVTGENSFIRLAEGESEEFTTTASHWRILFSPAGPGHVLFLTSELTDNEIAVYSDNIAMTRWLQDEIESMINLPFADPDLPVIDATFEREGDVRSYSTELVMGRDLDLSMTWYDFMEPMAIHVPPGTGGRSHGVYTIMFPARRAQIVLNGTFSSGSPQQVERDGHPTSTACLAWSETWVRPRE